MSNMVDTKFVGVRELKQTAPALVRRAARGERIVITRYGRPAALLSEVTPPIDSTGARRQTWEKERLAFDSLPRRATKRLRGRYVAVSQGNLIDSDLDHERLYERVSRKLRGRVFFIGRVGPSIPVIDMPGFEIE
jgi:antitoxin (DNA-binding transcriptional repressor) of toxin-antitoxin stability system